MTRSLLLSLPVVFVFSSSRQRPLAVIKREMLAGIDKNKILFVVEDRSRVVAMWRSEGLVCWQCAPGEF